MDRFSRSLEPQLRSAGFRGQLSADHPLAPQAELEIAQGFTHHGRHQSAVDRLKMMIDNPEYENCEQLPIARQMMGQAYFFQQRFDDAIES